MMTKSLAWIVVGFIFFVPSVILIWLSAHNKIDLRPLVPMVISLSTLFAFEVIATLNHKRFIWAVISVSTKDKLVLALCLLVFCLASGFATQFTDGLRWLGLLILLFGFGLAGTVFNLFMSKTAKKEFQKPSNIFNRD